MHCSNASFLFASTILLLNLMIYLRNNLSLEVDRLKVVMQVANLSGHKLHPSMFEISCLDGSLQAAVLNCWLP